MKILVACEESQAVTIELRRLGHEAYSCDIIPCSGGHPEWHLQQDVTPLLREKWDMIIAFPPCTHLAVSGARHFAQKRKDGRQQQGIDFFMMFANADCDRESYRHYVERLEKTRSDHTTVDVWRQLLKKHLFVVKRLAPIGPGGYGTARIGMERVGRQAHRSKETPAKVVF